MTTDATRSTVEAVWRIESPRLLASLTRITRDVGLAEEVAQDALVAALEQWPERGQPDNPGAWLMTTARRRAIDRFRREERLTRREAALARELEQDQNVVGSDAEAAIEDHVGDDLLALMFVACHPVLSAEARVALTLKIVGGLSTEEIARAYLVKESTVAQRIVRAKRTLAAADVAFEVPEGAALDARIDDVLAVVYLVFNEGYAATGGAEVLRPELCNEAMRLGRVLAALTPRDPQVHGLVALMELQASRSRARVDATGAPVLLLDQNRALWDRVLLTHGLAALDRALALDGGSEAATSRGTYVLQAQLAACHARARRAEDTDWLRIAELYDELLAATGSPVVDLNRAVAHGMAFGPAQALPIVERLDAGGVLAGYHLLQSVRGDLLLKLGRAAEARIAFEQAAAMTSNERERVLLRGRADACGG